MQSDRVDRQRPQARVAPTMTVVTVVLRQVAAARRAPAPSLPLMPIRRMWQATVGSVWERCRPYAVLRTQVPAVKEEEPAAKVHVVTEECANEVGEAATVVPATDREAREVRNRL